MRLTVLAAIACVAVTACGDRPKEWRCTWQGRDGAPNITIPAEQMSDGDLVWRDQDGLGHRISGDDILNWKCRRARPDEIPVEP
jgi:hypothetical protein